MSTSPESIRRAAQATASVPERHTALRVMAGTVSGIPAPTADWRAGFCPAPPCSTWPATTYCTSSGATPARARAAVMACAPSAVAGMEAKAPVNFTKGVRA